MEISSQLETLGLTAREVGVYTSLHRLGPASPTELAQAANILRPNVYEVCTALEKQGLIHQEFRGKKKVFVAESPTHLEDIVKLKLVTAKNLVPYLEALSGERGFQAIVHFYQGKKAMQNLFKDALSGNANELWYLWSPKDMDKILEKKVIEQFIAKRLKKGIRLRSLRPAEKESFYQIESDTTAGKRLTEVGYVPEKYTFSLSLGIYGNRVAFFSSQKESFGFLIESKEMTQVMRMFYDGLWSQSGKLRQ